MTPTVEEKKQYEVYSIFGLKKRSLCSFLTNKLFQDKEVVIELPEKHFFFSCTRPRVDSDIDILHLEQDWQNAFHAI